MKTWRELKTECNACKKCALHETRTNVVFGVGDENSKILFIGEGPGEQEDLTGEPFVGRAGKLLDDMLEIIGLNRANIYIANIVKCRPPKNRDPLEAEQRACIGYLNAQIALLRPRLIVCLGRVAAKVMIREDFKITEEHGVWFERGDHKITAMYHPAALLRDPRKKPDTFDDLKKIQAELAALG